MSTCFVHINLGEAKDALCSVSFVVLRLLEVLNRIKLLKPHVTHSEHKFWHVIDKYILGFFIRTLESACDNELTYCHKRWL